MRLITDEQHAQIVEALSDERYVSQYSHIVEALATLQALPEVEATVWQYRTKPSWDTFAPWCNWQLCGKGNYDDYKRAAERKGDWSYQARELYATKERS